MPMSNSNLGVLKARVLNAEERTFGTNRVLKLNLSFGGGKNKDGTFKDPGYVQAAAWNLDPDLVAKITSNLKQAVVLVTYELGFSQWEDKKTGEKRSANELNVKELCLLEIRQPRPQTETVAASSSNDSDIPF